MELHRVHCNADGESAVVGFLIAESDANADFGPAWAHLPPDPGTICTIPGESDLNALLTLFRTTWRYTGLLTPLPCAAPR